MAARTSVAARPGIITWRGSANVPTGWLLCDGQEVSRTTFADLFDAIGTDYGAGNGTTTFNVPDLIDRFALGPGGGHGMGGTGGTANHDHSLASHDHTTNQPSNHSTHTSEGGHDHVNHTTSGAAVQTVQGASALVTNAAHQTGGAHTHSGGHVHTGTAIQSGGAVTTGTAQPPFLDLVPFIRT